MIRVQVHGEQGLLRMAHGCAQGPDHLRHNLARAVRSAAQPVIREMKQAIAMNPIRGFRKGGRRRYRGPSAPKALRASIAAVTELDLNVGGLSPRAQFVVHTSRLGPRRRLPELIESGRPWRHPIMGKRGGWAASQGKPWFEVSYRRRRPLFDRRVDEATERTARAIERAG